MNIRTHGRKAATSTPAAASAYASPARPFVSPGPSTETPDLKAQKDRAERFGHHFDRIRVTAEVPEAGRAANGPAPSRGTPPWEAPIQRRGPKGKRRRRRAKQWKQRQRQEAETDQDSDLTDADEVAWNRSLDATADLIPRGHQTVKKDSFRGEDALEALTSFRGKTIKVDYNPDLPSDRRDWRIGQLAQTFTHELAAHGKNLGQKEPDEEHAEMHDPDSREEYLSASRRTFNRLDNNAQKRAFVRSWHSDMNKQIDWDEDLGRSEKRERRNWVRKRRDSMIDAIQRPEKHAWTEEE